MGDVVEELRDLETWFDGHGLRTQSAMMDRAADTITTLRAQLAKQSEQAEALRGALEPFVQALDDWGDEGGGVNFDIFEHPTAINITLDHLRDAKTAIAQPKGSGQ